MKTFLFHQINGDERDMQVVEAETLDKALKLAGVSGIIVQPDERVYKVYEFERPSEILAIAKKQEAR